MKMLSDRSRKLKPSVVMDLMARGQKLKREGADVISLSVGEPTWATPASICEAGIKAIQEGHTKYTPANGSQKIRESIAFDTKKCLGLSVEASQVTVSIGAKFVLFSAIQSLCDPGEEVLIPTPHWVSYPSMVELAKGCLVPIPTTPEQQFKLGSDQLRKHISKKSKILILNSPNNPSGAVFTFEELKAIGEVLRENPHIYVFSDDIYNRLCFTNPLAPHLLQACPDLKERVLCINAVSKNYSMPGWRVGWAVGNEDIIKAMSKFQSQSVSCASSISQEAVAWALRNCDEELEQIRTMLIQTKNLALDLFSGIDSLDVFPPQGAFYLWFGIKKLLGSSFKGQDIHSSADFAEALLKEKLVLCVPGEAFNYPGYIRIHFAVDATLFAKATERVKDFTSALS